MPSKPTIAFARLAAPKKGNVVLLAGDGADLTDHARACDPAGILARVFAISEFKGKAGAVADVIAPHGAPYDRLTVVGVGKAEALDEFAWLKVGGNVAAQTRKPAEFTVVADVPGTTPDARDIANLAAGITLRAYSFDKYKTKKEDEKAKSVAGAKYTILCADPAAAKKAFADVEAVIDGVFLARDLVNEPANALGPVEIADYAQALGGLGVAVDVLTEKEMKKLGMGALLGVAQGAARPARVVVMRWSGGKPKEAPVAFIGKGVVFDSGGLSIKPAASMEDMKGDMGGAAAVVGLMHALAARKAKVNAIGLVGLVENMVDANAQRPGDIVSSMSGQTIEVLNTDAEGRLVLADVLWYCQERFKPKFMVDLATLTGAVMVALGNHHAGLFSNDDELAERMTRAGLATQERVWRLPLGPEYDKLIDSKIADMKNIGGRFGGAITAAQFLQRFVRDTPWAHLDIAGTAMGSPPTEISQSWGSGFGVRLLDRLVRDHYEG
ncbi:MAG: leucyl aminopeptidase [Rhizobiaceae bacterium]